MLLIKINEQDLLHDVSDSITYLTTVHLLYIICLTLVYMGGGGGGGAVFCYSSKTVGARLLKLCDFYC